MFLSATPQKNSSVPYSCDVHISLFSQPWNHCSKVFRKYCWSYRWLPSYQIHWSFLSPHFISPIRSMWQLITFSFIKYFTSLTSRIPFQLVLLKFNGWFLSILLTLWCIYVRLPQDSANRVLLISSHPIIHAYGLIDNQCANS